MRKLRILMLMHEELVPPASVTPQQKKEMPEWLLEYRICNELENMGHKLLKLGLNYDLRPLRDSIDEFKPHIAFNLLEHFHYQVQFDQNIVSYLELRKIPYTGCNPRGLTLARDKALTKKVLAYHRIPIPIFAVMPRGRHIKRPKRLGFPLIVKPLVEQGSHGISQASVVDSDEKLIERVKFVHQSINTDAIIEQYIDGRELYVGMLGNRRLQVFPTWELDFTKMQADSIPIASSRVKWNKKYQKRHGLKWRKGKLEPAAEQILAKLSKRIYRALNLSGYARLDYRMTDQGKFYLLEANPNPSLRKEDEFAEAAKASGVDYGTLVKQIVNTGLQGARTGP